jgi:hypothetical protein
VICVAVTSLSARSRIRKTTVISNPLRWILRARRVADGLNRERRLGYPCPARA